MKIAVPATLLGVALFQHAHAALVFSDNFNRPDSATLGQGWAQTDTGGGHSQIANQTLVIHNGSPGGRSFVSQDSRTFATGGYQPQLNQNPGLVRWHFNLRSSRDNLSGFAGNNYGIALVLATSSPDFLSGTGYAVVWGGSGSQPLRLVRYDAGLATGSTLTDLITATLAPFSDMNRNYFSVEVGYDPAGNTWTLAAHDDGSENFADPSAGTLTLLGQTVDGQYTSTALNHMGALWNYSTAAGNQASFDHLSVEVVPEPAVCGWIAAAILGLCVVGKNLRLRRR